MNLINLACLILILLFSCQSSDSNRSSSNNKRETCILEVYDTVRFNFNYQNIKLVDYLSGPNYILGLNRSKAELIIFDLEGNELSKIEQTSGKLGPGFVRGAGFMSKDKVWCFGAFGYAVYDLEGNLLNTGYFDNQEIVTNMNQWMAVSKTNMDEITTLYIPGSDQVLREYNKETLLSYANITSYNLNSNSYFAGVHITENSPYLEGIIPMMGPLFDISTDLLYVIFPQDRLLATYDVESLDLIHQHNLDPKYFGDPLLIPFNKPELMKSEKSREYELMNSKFISLKCTGDQYVVLCYEKGLDIDQAKEDMATGNST